MSHRALLESAQLRLDLWRVGDRFTHRVYAAGADVLLLASWEGEPDEVWPSSPPLQELHLETRPGGRELALLVGMAGHSHWSLSAELDAAAETLTFDVACRVRGPSGSLGSRYRSERHWQWSPDRAAAFCTAGDQDYRLEVDRALAPPARLEFPTANLVSIEPDSADAGAVAPRTIRWRYVVSALPR